MFVFSSESTELDWEKEPDLAEFRRLYDLAEKNPALTVVGFENLANRGSLASMLHLGSGYLKGVPEKNIEKAKHWYLIASDKGHQDASMIYGRICLSTKDYAEAKRVYEKMSLLENPEAIYFLGKIHLTAKESKISQDLGMSLLKKSSELGHPFASRDLAFLMLTGKLGWANFLQGFPFIVRSASQLLKIVFNKGSN